MSRKPMADSSAVVGASNTFGGMNAVDYSGYPDCRAEYMEAFDNMANLATKAAVEGKQRIRIHKPLIRLSKAEIIRRGLELGVDYSLTNSCYDPDRDTGAACGHCDACLLRLKGFGANGGAAPIAYVTQ